MTIPHVLRFSPGCGRINRTLLLAALTAILLASSPFASFGQPDAGTARAVRASSAPRIDGVLNEPVWTSAPAITDFLQYDPIEGSAPTQRTDIRILYDHDALYIGATMYDSEPDKIVARLARRDGQVESDRISFEFDTYNDRQTSYEFTVNAAGVKVDILRYDDGAREDESWDAVWDVETMIGNHGWTAEIRIPLAMLRFNDAAEQDWGFQIIRVIQRNNEVLHSTLIRRSESGWVSKFGRLRGIEGIESRASLEVLPYALAQSSSLTARGDRLAVHRQSLNAGVDLKYRPSGAITIDATINPDFGQVEADPAVLNLSTFETFYPEKRPFFIEGVQILRFTTFGDGFGPGLFYSRRIGRSLSASAPENGSIEEEPRFATILGAAKISGKTASGLSFGVLEAVTGEETATVLDSNGVRSTPRVEPTTNYSLVRLRQDFRGNSNVGMILTSVNRFDRIPAFTGGIDWSLRFMDNMYRIAGFLGHNRTGMRGFTEEGSAGSVTFAKDGGPHWRGSLGADFTSRRYNINDIGFFRRPNDHGLTGNITYRDDTVDDWKRQWNVGIGKHLRWNYERAEINNSWNASAYIRLLNYWEMGIDASIDAGDFDDRETRGHGLFATPVERQIRLSIESDSRSSVVGELSLGTASDDRGAQEREISIELKFKPAAALTIEAEVAHEAIDRQFAWYTNTNDPLVAPFEVAVFADRTTRLWDATIRGSFVFTHNLTLQWYTQWFVAKGEFVRPQARLDVNSYAPIGLAASEFSDLSFNSNLVLRWEYLPGSTLFLVWSHGRIGPGGPFRSDIGQDASDTFRLPPDNVVLVKLSYWFST